MSGGQYLSSDDSELLRRALRRFSGGTALEIGAGNAGTLVDLKKRFKTVAGTDVERPGMDDWKGLGADFVLADRASCFRDGTFDLVAFNPPYLEGEHGDRAIDGGPGLEAPLRFLEEGLRVVGPSGAVVVLLDARTDTEPFRRASESAGFVLELIDSERLFFEELAVYAARRKEQTAAGSIMNALSS